MGDDIFMAVHYRTAISATARNNVPAISFTPQFAKDGGLMSYNSVITDQFRGAAGYVDRILTVRSRTTCRCRRRRNSR